MRWSLSLEAIPTNDNLDKATDKELFHIHGKKTRLFNQLQKMEKTFLSTLGMKAKDKGV